MTEWSAYIDYTCRYCADKCLNERDSEAAENEVCWECFPHLSIRLDEPDTTSERPEGRPPYMGADRGNASARPQAERRGHSSARKPGGGRPERGSGSGRGAESESGRGFWDI